MRHCSPPFRPIVLGAERIKNCRTRSPNLGGGPMPGLLRLIFTAALLFAGAAATHAQAQTYPNRPIRLLVGFPPGGAVDLIARLYGQGLSVRLGQPVVIENKPGSGSNLAADIAAKSAPDGYTLFHGTDNVFMSNPHVYGRMPFDVFKDLGPVASVSSHPLVLAAPPSRP